MNYIMMLSDETVNLQRSGENSFDKVRAKLIELKCEKIEFKYLTGVVTFETEQQVTADWIVGENAKFPEATSVEVQVVAGTCPVDLEAATLKSSVHKKIVGNFKGAYTLGIANEHFVLKVSTEDISQFPTEIELDGNQIQVAVEGNYRQAKPQATEERPRLDLPVTIPRRGCCTVQPDVQRVLGAVLPEVVTMSHNTPLVVDLSGKM